MVAWTIVRESAEEVDLDMYTDSETLAQEINVLLYIKYGIEDDEDYQMMNDTRIIYTDTVNGLWKQTKTLLS